MKRNTSVRRIAGGSERLPKASVAVTDLNRRMKASSSTPLPTFVAPGFHAAFESASYDKSNGKQTITVTATNRGAERLESLDVLLLDFTSQGTVSRMEKRTLTLALAPNAKQTAFFESTLPRDLGQSQILSIASVTHETKKQDVDLKALAKALAIQQAG